MQTIKNDSEKPLGNAAIDAVNSTKKKVAKQFVNYSSMFVGIFLVLVVIAVFTTDIRLMSAAAWAELGLTFFILLFCSYSMYVNFSDSGTRAGRASTIFLDAQGEHDKIKKLILESKKDFRLLEFCKHYIAEELRAVREGILSNDGIKYEVYKDKYIGKDEATLKADKTLSDKQVKAIVKANNVKPIKLTPEMILKRGRGDGSRNPLGTNPKTKKRLHYIIKFITTFVTSILTGIIVFDIIVEPSWATVVSCLFKLLTIVLNGFMGYKMGFENIAVETVNYMNDQIDLMQQFIQYTDKNPEPVIEESEQVEERAPVEALVPEINTEN